MWRIRPSAPDDHVTAAQDSRVSVSAIRRVSYTCRHPTVRDGIVFPARVELAAFAFSAPNDHLASCPTCRVTSPRDSRFGSVGGHQVIRSGTISCAWFRKEDGFL